MNFMKGTMKELQGKWARGIRYELSVACVACREKRNTLHLLPLGEYQHAKDDEVYCEFTEDHIHMSYYWNQLQNLTTARMLNAQTINKAYLRAFLLNYLCHVT